MSATLGQIVERLRRERLLVAAALDAEAIAAPVAAVAADSRAVRPGTLFCAVSGTAGDGHDFLGAAAAAGAVAATVERVDPDVPLLQVRVTAGRLAAAYAAAEFHGDPWHELTLVGVSGTNGKTTSAAILRHLLARRYPTASIGTLGVVGTEGRVIPGSEGLTTPGPVELAAWLAGLKGEGVRAVAMEVSSHALDQGRAAALRFDGAVLTNLTRDHLDYHGTLDAYREAKLVLLDLLKPDGVAALNADDPAWTGVEPPAGRLVRFGVELPADVTAADVRIGAHGMAFRLRTPDAEVHVELPLFGRFNVSNALGAAAVLWGLGWHAGEIAAGLRTLPQVRGRLERIPTPVGMPAVVIDFAHTPDALARALAALRPLVRGRLLVVFGAGGDRDPGKRPEMGRVAAAGADLAIVTSDNPRTEDPARIADDIERGMGTAPRLRIVDRREAIHRAIESAGPDDLVLLAGKGHETYQIRGTERYPFDEREVVRETLARVEATR